MVHAIWIGFHVLIPHVLMVPGQERTTRSLSGFRFLTAGQASHICMRVFKEIPIVDESCTDPCNLGSDSLWHETMTGHIEALFPYQS